jgi:cytidylate kinase
MSGVVAIDGPSGAGKSTVARSTADALGLPALDTGAMYRAVTLAVLHRGIDPSDGDRCAAVAREVDLQIDGTVVLDGHDISRSIRGPEVTAAVSTVSAHPGVRSALVARQRGWVDQHGGGVVEGRDIGTVVFPDATVKVFLTASERERARRRQRDEAAAERTVDVESVREDLERRDRADSTRPVSPLQPAEGALVLDTTNLSVADIVSTIVERFRLATDRTPGETGAS